MLLAQPRASLRSEPNWLLPGDPMEIATEMSRIELEMRDSIANTKVKKQRLHLLAESFLRVTGQGTPSDSVPCGDIRSSDPIGVN